MKSLLHCASTICSALMSFISIAAAETGEWVPQESFAQVNIACTRVYFCQPMTDVLHSEDTKIMKTPNQLVWGICSADGGPVDSCNSCLTNSPTQSCEWHLEKR
jgi:hypothetical protein